MAKSSACGRRRYSSTFCSSGFMASRSPMNTSVGAVIVLSFLKGLVGGPDLARFLNDHVSSAALGGSTAVGWGRLRLLPDISDGGCFGSELCYSEGRLDRVKNV